jgi:hypothetical protein
VIDRSQEVHLKVESQEAQHFTGRCSDFIDDVVIGRIDRKSPFSITVEKEPVSPFFAVDNSFLTVRIFTIIFIDFCNLSM